MKLSFFAFFTLLGLFSLAQSDSKVLFFRRDPGLFSLRIANTGARLCLEKNTINKTHKHSVFVYSPAKTGHYFVKHDFKKGISLAPAPHTITFVEIRSTMGFWRDRHPLRQISFADFKKLYHKKKWLRKRLSKAGYDSVDKLIGDYRINE